MERSGNSGFSLVEALVAMAVLAVSASVILSATEHHARSIGDIEDRMIARWIAQNRLVALGLGLENLPEVVTMGGRDWRVRSDLSDTAEPDLARVEIRVGLMAAEGGTLAQLTGFIDTARGST